MRFTIPGKQLGAFVCGRPVPRRALDGPPASVVSRTGVSRQPPTLAEGWSAVRDRPRRGFEPPSNSTMIGELRPLRAEGRPIGSSPADAAPSSACRGPAPRSAAAAAPSCVFAPLSASTGIGERRGRPFSATEESNGAIRNLRRHRLADPNPPGRRRRCGRRDSRRTGVRPQRRRPGRDGRLDSRAQPRRQGRRRHREAARPGGGRPSRARRSRSTPSNSTASATGSPPPEPRTTGGTPASRPARSPLI